MKGVRNQPPLAPAEQLVFLHALRAKHLRVYASARLMLQLGLRLNEARNARWGWFSELTTFAACINIPAAATKTRYPRQLPLPEDLRLFLLELRNAQKLDAPLEPPDGWPLILNRFGAPPSRRYIQRTIRETALAAIGRPIRPHTLRHTFATQLLNVSNLRIVQDALGHRSIKSTERYTHPNLGDLKRALEAVNPQTVEGPTL